MKGKQYISGQVVAAESYYDLQDDKTEWSVRAVFDAQKERGIHLSKYDDQVWKLTDGHAYKYIRYENVLGVPSGYSRDEYISILKYYAVLSLDMTSYATVAIMISKLIRIGNEVFGGIVSNSKTNNSTIRLLRDFEQQTGIIFDTFDEWVDFVDEDGSDVRELATSYATYYKMDKLFIHFWADASDEDKMVFGAIYLYWRFASIVPTRVKEFCILPKDCLRHEVDGYYLLVRKINIKGTNKLIYNNIYLDCPIMPIHISDELATKFLEYQQLMTDLVGESDSEFFFTNLATNKLYGRNADTHFDTRIFRARLKQFYKKVVMDQYGYQLVAFDGPVVQISPYDKNIERIRLGDLRQLSIRSMFSLGVDPAIIMGLAGHDRLSTTLGYGNNTNNLTNDLMTFCRAVREKETEQAFAYYRVDLDRPCRRVPDGYCYANEDQKQCCYLWRRCSDGCKYFRFDDKNKVKQLQINTISEMQQACDMFKRMNVENHYFDYMELIKEIQDRESKFSWLEEQIKWHDTSSTQTKN